MNYNDNQKIYFSKEFSNKLLGVCKSNYPDYTRGLIVTKGDIYRPSNVYYFEDNLRKKDKKIDEHYEKFGPYYKKHKGFVSNPLELIKIEDSLTENEEKICAVFHVHIDFPACPTRLDIEMYYETVIDIDNVWYLIISFMDPENPEIRAFWIKNKLIHEIEIVYEGKEKS